MGNAQLLPKNDNTTLQITTTLVQEFQKHVTLVDHAVTGLARGIDAMTSTCKWTLEPINEYISQKPDISHGSGGLNSIVLTALQENISENKAVMIVAVRDLLNAIIESFISYIDAVDNEPIKLAVNTYFQLNQNGLANEIEFRKRVVEGMKKEITFLMSKIDLQKQEIDICEEKVEFYQQEIKKLRSDCQIHAKRNIEVQTDTEGLLTCYTRDTMVREQDNFNDHYTEQQVSASKSLQTDEYITIKKGLTNDQIQCSSENKTGLKSTTEIKQSDMETTANKLVSVENEKRSTTDGKISNKVNCVSKTSSDYQLATQRFVTDTAKDRSDKATETTDTEQISSFAESATSTEMENDLEIQKLQRQIKTLMRQLEINRSREVIYVQLFRREPFSAFVADDKLMSSVREILERKNIELIIQRPQEPKLRDENMPLLISCDHISIYMPGLRKSKTLQTAIKEFKGLCSTHQMAVVIFYSGREKEFRKEIEQNNDSSLGLGGIFHVGHSATLYKSSLNDKAIEGIVSFILSVGKKTKKLTDTPV